MRIVGVNAGREEVLHHGRRSFHTGIVKRAVPGPVAIGFAGVDGDRVCDTEHHGGADQAVYVYSADDYAWWSRQLERELAPGTFGDNLTIEGLPTDLGVGDRLLAGDVVLEVTAPRIPCSTLAARMQDSNFGLQFRRAERPGAYCRVLHEGTVRAGDSVTRVEAAGPQVTIVDLFRLSYETRPDPAKLERCLRAPVAERMRLKFEQRLSSSAEIG